MGYHMHRLPRHAALLLLSATMLSLGGCQRSADPAVPVAGSRPAGAQMQRTTIPAAGEAVDPKAAVPSGQATHWECGDLRVASRIDARDGGTTLYISGRKLHLPTAASPPAEGHIDDEGNTFVLRGGAATLTLRGEDARECTVTGQPSPWYDAAARGVAFRAVGSEPGWFVELGPGDSPTLRATLDYGERTIEVPDMQLRPDGGQPGFLGTAADGSTVVLSVRREACADGMSGEKFAARARLLVGANRYEGCGAFLSD